MSFLSLQIQGAVGFKSMHTSQLSEAAEERLLFFLGMCRQNLLGQAQFLVSLSLWIVRWECSRRDGETLTFSSFGAGDVFDDFYERTKKTFNSTMSAVLSHRWQDQHLFKSCIKDFSCVSHAWWDGNQGKMQAGWINFWSPAWLICTFILLINSIKVFAINFLSPCCGKILLTLQVKFGREFLLWRDVSCWGYD